VSATEERSYVLGTEDAELVRLGNQHQTWVQACYDLFARAGLRTGDRVLDLGCGPGFTTMELARLVGPTGSVVAIDQSQRFLDHLAAVARHAGTTWARPLAAQLEHVDLPPASFDAAYSRWLFCWLTDAEPALANTVRALRPGGALLLHEYLHWGSMRLVPECPAFARAVQGCMASWPASGATIDFAMQVPSIAERHGLRIEHFAPIARLGAVGSLEWRWLTEFFANYLPKLVDRGLLTGPEVDAALTSLRERTTRGLGYCYTPTVAAVVLRKP